MSEDNSKYNTRFEDQAKGFAVGDNNIIYNYFGYREEVKTAPVDVTDDNLPCPYRSLYQFTPNDSDFFFGREVFVEKLFQATQNRNFIPVLGASGSGKSSVVLAGLVPKLEQEGHWKFTHFRPGSDPFHALSVALVPLYTLDLDETDQIAQARKLSNYLKNKTISLSDVFAKIQQNCHNHRVLLIADQFEELYTQCPQQEVRNQFLDCLLTNFQSSNSGTFSSTVLVTTMRADFLANALSYRPFTDMLQNADIKIGAMSREELKEVIEKPAEKLGVRFEAGLVERILNDVEDEPGNLPLLEFALTELWEKRIGKQLTHDAYKAIGEVKGALANYADGKYNRLTTEEKEQARGIFIELVRLGQGQEDTRRVVTKGQLGESDWNFVKKLADERLVVTNQNAKKQKTVEIVHESLIKNWKLLDKWLDESRDEIRKKRKIEDAAQEWQTSGQKTDYLLSKKRLKEAKDFQKEEKEKYSLSPLATDFVNTSIKYQRRERIKTWGLFFIIPLIGTTIGGYFLYQELTLQVHLRKVNECEGEEYCSGRIESLEKLVEANRNLKSINLRSTNLSGANLSGANLSGVNLQEANLSGAFLYDANLSGVNLQEGNLSGAFLSGAFLSGANLSGANLKEANLSDVNLSGANLSGANLLGVYLYHTNLLGTNLSGVNLQEANLSGVNLQEANLSGAFIYHAIFFGAKNLTNQQVKKACGWKSAYFARYWDRKKQKWVGDEEKQNAKVKELKEDKASNPKDKPDCSS